MTLMCLGYVKRKELAPIQKFSAVPSSDVRQGQAPFLPMVEDNKYYYGFKLP
jgi:hypothetical protein